MHVSTFLTSMIEKKFFLCFQLWLLTLYNILYIKFNSIFYLIGIKSIPRCCFCSTFFLSQLFFAKKYVHKHTQNVSGRFYRYILLQMRRRIKAVFLCLQGQDINLNGVFPISKTDVLHNSRYIFSYYWYSMHLCCILCIVCMYI